MMKKVLVFCLVLAGGALATTAIDSSLGVVIADRLSQNIHIFAIFMWGFLAGMTLRS